MSRKVAKSLSALLLALAIAVTQLPAGSAEASAVLSSEYETDGTTLLRYTGTAETVSVPDGIKEIAEEAFAGNDYLISVEIGGDVEKIDYRAFAGCDNLRTVKIGDSVTEIGVGAFSNDTALVNVSIGAGVKDLGSGVFAGCTNLKSLTLSEDHPYLSYSNGVLYDDEETIIYALMPGYEKDAFTLPNTVEEIKAYAFWGNPYLSYVKLDSALTNVPAYAFSNCMNLREVYIPLPVRTIEAEAFQDCVNLETVNIPESMTNISDSAFDGCTKVTFDTVAGTYGETFAASFASSQADQIEYEDTGDTTVVSQDELNADSSSDSNADQSASEASVSPAADTDDTNGQESASPTATVPSSANVFEGSYSSDTLLGQSSIVAGRAVIFIDNGQSSIVNGSTGKVNLQSTDGEGTGGETMNLLSENAEKGKDFPKYTIVNGKVASQAYYQDDSITDFTTEETITEIGDFAFARSGLRSIDIPDGVTTIGYGAFYHCDNLSDVSIPDSVTDVAGNAFAKTPWLSAAIKNAKDYPFLVVGDGLLLAYDGSESVVNIPGSVKHIADSCFADHMGITAVNIPDSVLSIGEAAFAGCKNLKTVNGGDHVQTIGAAAFQDCPLTTIRIPASVTEIGIAAYDNTGGTDTVTFEGSSIPELTSGYSAERLSGEDARALIFSSCKTAIVASDVTADDLSGTVLQDGAYGMSGTLQTENGSVIATLNGPANVTTQSGVTVSVNSSKITDGENTMATMPGNDGSYLLRIADSSEAGEQITSAYGELYGGAAPAGLAAFDISLYDSTGQLSIRKLGRQYVTVQFPLPSGLSADNLHLVTLDADGQLEAVDYQILSLEDGTYVQFKAEHFSPYGFYTGTSGSYSATVLNGSAVIGGSGQKDASPDTGDYAIEPKYVLALGLLFAAVALFFYKGKRTVR